jgi:hypothetical protein
MAFAKEIVFAGSERRKLFSTDRYQVTICKPGKRKFKSA